MLPKQITEFPIRWGMMEQEAEERGTNLLNESNRLDDEQIGEWVLYQSTLTVFFFLGQKALLALPPWLAFLPLKQTTANLTILSPFSSLPLSLFFVFTCLLSFSSSCSKAESCHKACHLWQRSQLTPWPWPTPLTTQCSYHVGQWLSCPLFPSLFTGLGYCLTFLPTVTILAQYFARRRALVTSVASSGESFAIFAFAPGECWVTEGQLAQIWPLSLFLADSYQVELFFGIIIIKGFMSESHKNS